MEIHEELEIRLREPIEWNPRDAFIETVATKVYYIVPAFIAGVMVGIVLWGLYILLYKAGHFVKRRTRRYVTARPSSEAVIYPSEAGPHIQVPLASATASPTVSTKASSVNSESSGKATPSSLI